MKYPNSKFTGLSMVTSTAIAAMISDYYPNASQRGGAQRLTLLQKTNDLSQLIDNCIVVLRAWDDAVMMGAGAYLNIGNYPTEIAAAKEYVKEEVEKYLTGVPFASASDYDAWHKTICENLSDNKKYFSAYSAYRKGITDKFKNKCGFTVGNAQKFLNMLMKDLYACFSHSTTFSAFLPNYEDYFTYCHMPLDSYILRFIDDIRFREKIDKSARTYTWSNLNSYESYIDEQKDIRDYVAKYNPTVTVLQTEFVVWPLYK